MIKKDNIKKSSNFNQGNIIFFLLFGVVLCIYTLTANYYHNKNDAILNFTKNNLITSQEKIGLSQLFNISGYHLTNNGNYVNKFEKKIYLLIFKIRKERPKKDDYFFCKHEEFAALSNLFNENVNNNITIIKMGEKIIDENRKKCLKLK